MRFTFASGLRTIFVAAALILASAYGADDQPSLIGATREQVLARNGEPRSVMRAAGREILFFAHERVVLRNGVVVEVERLAASAAPRPSSSSVITLPSDSAPAEKSAANVAEPAAGAARGGTQPVPSTAPATKAGTPAAAAPGTEPATAPATVAAPSETQISIKSVQPPGGAYVRPVLKKTAPAPSESIATAVAVPPPAATTPAETPRAAPAPRVREPATRAVTPLPVERPATTATSPQVRPAATDVALPPPRPAERFVSAAPAVQDRPAVQLEARPAPVQPRVDPAEARPTPPEAKPTPPAAAPAAVKQRLDSDDLRLPEKSGTPSKAKMYLFVIGGALVLAYIIWRIRQRQVELAASAVSRNPFAAEPVTAARTGEKFTPEFLATLDANHFEELVTSYYGKTGVVATRTKSGPGSPVHIRISWKGESRPFALVQCIPQPPALIEEKPLQDLFAALAAEDIRRGYVVTTGQFSVDARDFAEEKQLTLMPGDVFLEKLNALPDSARDEIRREVAAASSSAPSVAT